MTSSSEYDIMIAAIKEFGPAAQIDMAIEECAELIKELSKYKRFKNNIPTVKEELADVSIMLKQMFFIFGDFSTIEQKKLSRLEHRLKIGKWEDFDK